MRRLIAGALALLLTAGSVAADEIRYQYDYNFPSGSITKASFMASMRGLHQQDLMPLRPLAKREIDGMEYSTDASAQAEYSGTGVTITSDSANEQEGAYSLKAVIDGTDNRSFERSVNLNLSAFGSITLWERSSGTSDTFQFFLEDSAGDQSRWDITSNGTADTWQQDTLDLSSPDSNNGTDADLSDIVTIGYRNLTLSTTYYFDTIEAIVGMTVAVLGTDLGSYYRHVYLGDQPVVVDAQAAPTLTAPVSNPRIDILSINSSGTLSWTAGTEASSPSIPWSSLDEDEMPIALVYLKTTMTKVVPYEDKDTDTSQGYIYADVRPFLRMNAPKKGLDVASASTITLGEGDVFDITGTTMINTITAKPAGTVAVLQFDGSATAADATGNLKLNGDFDAAAESVLMLYSDGTSWYEIARQPTAGDFLALSDTPSSYSGQGLKYTRVNAGETALELVSNPFDTSTGHDHDGTDSKKVVVTNVDPTGVTDGYLVKRSGSALAGTNRVDRSWLDVSAGSYQAVADDTEVVTSTCGGSGPVIPAPETEVKVKEIVTPVNGQLRIYFEFAENNHTSGSSAYARVYRNGSQLSSRYANNSSNYSGGDSPVTYDSSGWSAGDLVQIYATNNTPGNCYKVRNFRISIDHPWDWTVN